MSIRLGVRRIDGSLVVGVFFYDSFSLQFKWGEDLRLGFHFFAEKVFD